MKVAFCSSSFIRSVCQAMKTGGIDAVPERSGPQSTVVSWWMMVVLRWLQNCRPRDFGLLRWRWTCELLARPLWESYRLRISSETIRRTLHQHGFVWRCPRPVVGPDDPEYASKLRSIRRLLDRLLPSETALFRMKSMSI